MSKLFGRNGVVGVGIWSFLVIPILIIGAVTGKVQGQEYFRLQGDFSIKSVNDSVGNLTMGKFYYDQNQKKIIYHITFPKVETWVFADTSVYRFSGDSLIARNKGASIHEFSIFSLAVNNHLSDYGLKNSIYNLEKVEKDGGMVITTWEPPTAMKDLLGRVVISNKNKRILGIVFFDKQEEVIRKQFFNEYGNFEGLEFPTEIVDIFISEEGEKSFQKTGYKNIKINEKDNSRFYNFKLPAGYEDLLAN